MVNVDWLSNNRGDDIQVVDVREPHEFVGELGHIAGSINVPMAKLMEQAQGWPKARPIVLVCKRSGRSRFATSRLEALGFERATALRGGMAAWNAHGLPIQT